MKKLIQLAIAKLIIVYLKTSNRFYRWILRLRGIEPDTIPEMIELRKRHPEYKGQDGAFIRDKKNSSSIVVVVLENIIRKRSNLRDASVQLVELYYDDFSRQWRDELSSGFCVNVLFLLPPSSKDSFLFRSVRCHVSRDLGAIQVLDIAKAEGIMYRRGCVFIGALRDVSQDVQILGRRNSFIYSTREYINKTNREKSDLSWSVNSLKSKTLNEVNYSGNLLGLLELLTLKFHHQFESANQVRFVYYDEKILKKKLTINTGKISLYNLLGIISDLCHFKWQINPNDPGLIILKDGSKAK